MVRKFRSATIGLVAISVGLASLVSAQVTSNVFLRVLMIQTSSGTGTAFTMDIDGRQYVITAKHMVKGLAGKQTISLRQNSTWVPIEVTVFPCADPVDIAVLVPPRVLTVTYPLEPGTAHKVIVTEEVYFLGFPYGSSIENVPMFGSNPVPMTKHGILSSAINGEIRVDAYNNPGFSGAPIVYRDLYDTGSTPVFYVLGVVQGFFPDLVPVTKPVPVRAGEDLSKVDGWRIQTVNGRRVVYRDTPGRVPLNTGILVGYTIDYAVNMIHEHPVGPEIPKQ